MRNVIKCNIKQGIVSTRFGICFTAVAVLIFLMSTEQLIEATRSCAPLKSGFHATFIINALSTDGLFFATPIVSAVSMSAAYIEDLKSNCIRYYLFRSSRKPYIMGRILGCYISGGLVSFIGIVLAFGVSSLLFMPMERAVEAGAENAPGLRDVISVALPFFLTGGFWAVFGLAISTFMESKYIAYASPFIAFYILVILHERYFGDLFVISPKEWLHPSSKWVMGSWGQAVIVFELTLLAAFLFALRAERRLSQL